MEYRNAIYNAHGTIDVEIDHPILGWIPFTASPGDPEGFGRAVYEAVSQGDVAPYLATPSVDAS